MSCDPFLLASKSFLTNAPKIRRVSCQLLCTLARNPGECNLEFFNRIGREETVAFLESRRWRLPKPDTGRQIKLRLLHMKIVQNAGDPISHGANSSGAASSRLQKPCTSSRFRTTAPTVISTPL